MKATPDTRIPRLRRTVRRILSVMLDTRGRWWLSLWLWLPMGGLAVAFSLSWQNSLGNSSGSSVSHVLIVRDENGYHAVSESGSIPYKRWIISYTLKYDLRPTQWQANVSYRVSRSSTGPLVNADLHQNTDVVGALVDAIQSRQWMSRDLHAQPWLTATWQDLARTGGGTRTRPAPLPTLLIYYSLSLIRWLALAGIGISLLHWFLRGTQVGAYKRMLSRHEAGRCPDCNYDISAFPDAVCPECGCDHRARRREAITALRHAGQWPIATELPTETGNDN